MALTNSLRIHVDTMVSYRYINLIHAVLGVYCCESAGQLQSIIEYCSRHHMIR